MVKETVKIEHKYLSFPTSKSAKSKNLLFFDGGELVYDLNINLDVISPSFTAYVDISRFMGKTLTLSIPQKTLFKYGAEDEIPEDTEEQKAKRPYIHHTVKNGWNNDPNGLYFYNGEYHLFYQYNPCSTDWENMHWGHAKSRDLFSWEELDTAVFPDKHGTVFSGCAFIDEKNRSGLKEGEHPPILLYYTACANSSELSRGTKTTQRLVCSADGGQTFKVYPNTIVEHMVACNRDPKVVWCEEMECYIMALFLINGDFCLLRSFDLLSWERFYDFKITGDSECPNIEKMPVLEGGKVVGYKWVIFGAFGAYIVGNFDKDGFIIEQNAFRPCSASANYAGQIFCGTEDEVVLIDWMKTQVKDARFSQSFSLPYRLSLVYESGRYFLCRDTVKQFNSRVKSVESYTFSGDLEIPINPGAYEIQLSAKYPAGGKTTLNIFGHDIVIDTKKNAVFVGEASCPISFDRKNIDVRIIVDKYSFEIFCDGGKFFFTACPDMDENFTHLTVRREGEPEKAELCVKALKI